MIDSKQRKGGIYKADQDQPGCGRNGLQRILIFVVVIGIGGFPVPHVSHQIAGYAVYFGQGQVGEGGFTGADAAVSAQPGKNNDIVLVWSCFTVIFDVFPFAFCIVYLVAESVYALNAQVGA